MNSQEFREEVLEYLSELEEGRQKAQDILDDTLLAFHNVCVKYDIEYQLFFGTLLGQIRDKGNIPWDYDVDLIIKFKDRAALIDALNKELGEKYQIYCYENGCNGISYLLRVAPKGYNINHYHVDVFSVVPAPNDKKEYEYYAKKLVKLSEARLKKINRSKPFAKGVPMGLRIKLILRAIKMAFVSTKRIDKRYLSLVDKLINMRTDYYMLADKWALVRRYPKKYIDNVKSGLLENAPYFVSADHDELLKICYGNWREYMPINQRYYEWYRSCMTLRNEKNINKNYLVIKKEDTSE